MLIQTLTKPVSMYEEVKLLQTFNVATTENALSFALKAVCEFANWDYGEAWVPSKNGKVLELSPDWYIRSGKNPATVTFLEMFRACSEAFVMAPNVGLPGRVWLSQNPEWIPNVSTQPEGYFIRNKIAKACQIKTGLGIPFFVHPEVEAVLVFFKTA